MVLLEAGMTLNEVNTRVLIGCFESVGLTPPDSESSGPLAEKRPLQSPVLATLVG